LSQPRATLGNGVAVSIPAIVAIPIIVVIATIVTISTIFAIAAILTNVAGVRLERQRRSLLQPEVGDNVAYLGYFIFKYTTPTGLPISPIFHNASFSDN
jgi:hypothetical protein